MRTLALVAALGFGVATAGPALAGANSLGGCGDYSTQSVEQETTSPNIADGTIKQTPRPETEQGG